MLAHLSHVINNLKVLTEVPRCLFACGTSHGVQLDLVLVPAVFTISSSGSRDSGDTNPQQLPETGDAQHLNQNLQRVHTYLIHRFRTWSPDHICLKVLRVNGVIICLSITHHSEAAPEPRTGSS